MIRFENREAINDEFKWDLSVLYKDDEAFLKDFKKIDALCDEVYEYKGRLTDSKENLFHAVEASLSLNRLSHNVYLYTHLNSDLDLRNDHYQTYQNMVKSKLVEVSSRLSFFVPELLKCDEARVLAFAEEYKDGKYKMYMDDILRDKPYVLSEAEEKVISNLGEIMGSPGSIFSMLNNAMS